MIPFLAAKGLFNLARGWWLAIAVAGLVALYFGVNGLLDRLTDNAKEQGATEQREADLTETLERTEQGNAARDTINRESAVGAGDALYRQCLRTARTPANCERFLSAGETDQR